MEEEKMIQQIADIVRKCGQIMLDAEHVKETVAAKEGHGNFVTFYDRKIQDILEKELTALLPESRFMGEETADADAGGSYMPDYDKGLVFVVDPIDGTTNFIKGYRNSAVSVGLLNDGKPYMAVIYNPYQDEMFTAVKGCGTQVNGRAVRVSENKLADGLAVFGTAIYYDGSAGPTFKRAFDYFTHALDIRRSGSAAIDLCTIAAGRAELFFEMRLQPWDYAAGALLVTEAGGSITQLDGSPITFDRPCSILACGSGVTEDEKMLEHGEAVTDAADEDDEKNGSTAE